LNFLITGYTQFLAYELITVTTYRNFGESRRHSCKSIIHSIFTLSEASKWHRYDDKPSLFYATYHTIALLTMTHRSSLWLIQGPQQIISWHLSRITNHLCFPVIHFMKLGIILLECSTNRNAHIVTSIDAYMKVPRSYSWWYAPIIEANPSTLSISCLFFWF